MHMPLVLTNRRRRGGSASAPAFSPSSLYSTGSQGIWLDPSDLSTMFSDRAGTTPVTTPGTVVGKRLDKSGRGNHATAPTDAARPVYGIEPKGGRRNLLTWSEDFGNAVWTKLATTVPATQYTAPDGTITADKLVEDTTTAFHIQRQLSYSVSAGQTITATCYMKAGERTWGILGIRVGTVAYFNLATGQVGNVIGAGAVSISSAGNGWYRCSVSHAFSFSEVTGPEVYTATGNGVGNYTGDGTSGILVWGAQLELGSTATNYQRVLSAYDVTESGVATTHYVQYDGSDDSMSTSAIDFTATDKMSVFAGVRKLSNVGLGVIAELGNGSGNGLYTLYYDTLNYSVISRGSSNALPVTPSSYSAPVSNILTTPCDISGDSAIIRVNGAQVVQSTTDQGTGNFGNYSMFFGRRNNASLPFNGKDYGLIVVGKAASAGEITDTETWLAAKTSGVTL